MPGGLLQIVAYGNQDLYLTGAPQITFFKVIYRRYTIFSIESYKVSFDTPVDFGSTAICVVEKTGDLMYRTYLEITLPEVKLQTQPTDTSELKTVYITARDNLYNTVYRFMAINRQAYISAYDTYLSPDTTSNNMIESVNNTFTNLSNVDTISEFRELLASNTSLIHVYEDISMQEIVNSIDSSHSKDDFIMVMNFGIKRSIAIQKIFHDDMMTKKTAYEQAANNNLEFAWVDRVGHAIIDYVEVKIGGQKIDKHYGDWINIWYELSANRNMESIYNKMIGNIPELTNLSVIVSDKVAKPQYTLTVPLQFWFCRYNGLAIPLVALQYHDVVFEVKFRKLEEVSYCGKDQIIYSNTLCSNIYLDDVTCYSASSMVLRANLLIDYVYLGELERKRFAQSGHEYLIDQVQQIEISDITTDTYKCTLNDFVHPSKELVWVLQKEKYLENPDGFTQCRWDNYTISNDNEGNIVKFASFDFHNYTRVMRLSGNYFNYVTPYEFHNTTPSDGINMYSFALFPE